MKKTRFLLMALLLMTVLVFASCGSKDDNNDAIPDNGQNSVEQDVEDGAEDIKDGAEDLGDDIEDGIDDAADEVEDAADGDGEAGNKNTDGDVSKNTADNGTHSQVQ